MWVIFGIGCEKFTPYAIVSALSCSCTSIETLGQC